ncbi:MAG: hypothetical protein AAFZ17_00780 [Cyanobacteria bacterium J06650_10]
MKRKWIEDNKLEIGSAIAAACLLAANSGSISAYMQQSAAEKQAYSATMQQIALIDAAELARKEAEPIARARYTDGCELVFNLDNQGLYTALVKGAPVIKGDYAPFYAANPSAEINPGHVLPAGMTVCDAYGNSAVLGYLDPSSTLPVALSFLTTTDKALVESVLLQHPDAQRPKAVN